MSSILLAEDDDEDCLLLEAALREAGIGCPLVRARDGEALLALARSGRRPTVIVLDLHMPRKGGLQVLAELRADARLAEIPVVVLSSAAAQKHAALTHGASAFWRKPERFADLVALAGSLRAFLAEPPSSPRS